MHIYRNQHILFCIGCFLVITLTCCHNFYMATPAKSTNVFETSGSISELQKQNRYFILRSGPKSFYMTGIAMNAVKTSITATLDSLPPDHKLYLTYGRKGKMLYHKDKDMAVLTEVHLFIAKDSTLQNGNYSVLLNKIQKIEVIEKDKGRTTGSYIVGAIGYTIGALAVAGIIIAATKSSCPFVSAYTNNEFVLQGEIYGGAIYPQLARDDYMPLRMQPLQNGTLQVKISNELQEKQFTDFADLLVISHDAKTKVLSDEKGNLYSVKDPMLPIKAWTGNQTNALASIQKANDNMLLHFDDTVSVNSENYLITQFEKPAGAKKAKLVLALKNSYWLDYLYGEMAKGFGSYYATYIKKQYKTPASQLKKWAEDQKLPLEVSIKTKAGWQKITGITTIGPLATREMIVPIDLTEITDPVIEIKMSSGFMFWEIDYAGIDYSGEHDFTVEQLSPTSAVDEAGKNVLSELIKRDGVYLEQPVPGNMVTLQYRCGVPDAKTSRSYILHTKGYYEHVRDFKGAPRVAFLKQFTQPNAFPAFSLQIYKKFSASSLSSLAQH